MFSNYRLNARFEHTLKDTEPGWRNAYDNHAWLEPFERERKLAIMAVVSCCVLGFVIWKFQIVALELGDLIDNAFDDGIRRCVARS